MDLTQATFQQELRGFALSILRNDEDAREVVQDVMLELVSKNPIEISRAYVFKAVRNHSLNRLRSRRRYQKAMEGFSAFIEVLFGIEESDATDIDELIAQLPQIHREVLVLRIKSELSHQEIGDVLGIPIGTVKSRINQAIKKLKKNVRNFQ